MESFSKHVVVERVFARKGAVASAAAASFVASGASLGIPWLVARVVRTATSEAEASIALFAGGFAGLLALRTLAVVVSNYTLAAAELDVAAALKRHVFSIIQRMGLGYHDRRSEGEKVAIITMDVDSVASFGVQTPVALLNAVVMFAGAAALMATISWKLTLVVALLGPVVYGGARVLGASVNRLSIAFWKENGELLQHVHESMHALRVIKVFARETDRDAGFAEVVERLTKTAKKRAHAIAWVGPLVQLVMYAGLLTLVLVGLFSSSVDTLSIDEVAAFALYGLLLTGPLRAWADAYTGFQSARAAWSRIDDATNEEAPEDLGDLDPDVRFAGAIAFENVTFSYPDRPPVFEGKSFEIAAGETIALVGPNGGGKTTVAHIIAALYPVNSGIVRLDGEPIDTYALATIRRNVGLVPQHSPLLNASIRDNLLLGRPDAGDAEMMSALVRAEAESFITTLPDGLDTLVGEDGLRLSGGQRQRIALARAFLEDAPILILDEATSNFDPESEANFLARNLEAWQDKTVLMITHRPATLELVDRVLEI